MCLGCGILAVRYVIFKMDKGFFFLRLSTASREFWDTEGGRLNRFPLEETILWAFASFFYNIFIFSYYISLDPFGLELFLGVIV
jgi:hypothetical protein